LWKAALCEALLAVGLLWIVGWLRTPESPLIVSILMVAVALSAITATVHALAHQRPIITIVAATIAGVIGTYSGIMIAYLVLAYTT
jgi:hypothetical protein